MVIDFRNAEVVKAFYQFLFIVKPIILNHLRAGGRARKNLGFGEELSSDLM